MVGGRSWPFAVWWTVIRTRRCRRGRQREAGRTDTIPLRRGCCRKAFGARLRGVSSHGRRRGRVAGARSGVEVDCAGEVLENHDPPSAGGGRREFGPREARPGFPDGSHPIRTRFHRRFFRSWSAISCVPEKGIF